MPASSGDSISHVISPLYLAILFVCLGIFLILSFFFSCSETTLFSLSKINLSHLRKKNEKKSNRLNKLLEDSRQTLITILLGNMIVNIAASLTAGLITEHCFQAFPVLSFLSGVILTTFLILLLGEIIPKSFAIYHAERIAFLFIMPITVAIVLLRPIQKILTIPTDFILKRFKAVDENNSNSLVNEEELKNLISMGEKTGAVKQDERSMIHSVFDFGDTTVDEIMTPRGEINALPVTATPEEVERLIHTSGNRRIPVYTDDLNEVLGILHLKDLMLYPDRSIQKLLRKPLFIPPKKGLVELLEEFKRSKSQIAVVVDEYGSTAGIVSMRDLLEEIFGKIRDIGDREEIIELKKNTFLIAGTAELEELSASLGINFPDNMGRTISGLIMNMLGKVPTAGEAIEYGGFQFRVGRMQRHRITQVVAQKI